MAKHLSVLVEEIIVALCPFAGGRYLDATFGGGGHSKAILEASYPSGKVLGIDRDPKTKEWATELEAHYDQRFEYRSTAYDELTEEAGEFDGIVVDLGMSSDQLESDSRGFSFQRSGQLDLRFNEKYGQTAAQIVNQESLPNLTRIFRDYAQDRYAYSLAKKIVAARRERSIQTTDDFNAIVGTKDPKVLAPLYQALRIETNNELERLRSGLTKLAMLLASNGVMAVISFHSLEDAIVKAFFRTSPILDVVTKKPIIPSREEIGRNPRSRSAKLRVAKKK